MFRHINYVEPYPRTLGPGLHPWVRDAGIANDDMTSLRHVHTLPDQPGQASPGEIVLFQHADFRGAHKHLLRDEPSFNASDDSFFNDRVSSLVVRSGRWRCYRHSNYVTPYPPLLSVGLFPWVGSLAITNDDMSSARIE
jgi:Beta/Gamma crystallin